MLIILPSVQRVLDRLYWQDFVKTGNVSDIYLECIRELEQLPMSIITTIAERPLSWARNNGTIVKVRYLWFLYEKHEDGTIIVDEVYDAVNNKILTERINNPTKKILDFQKRMDMVVL